MTATTMTATEARQYEQTMYRNDATIMAAIFGVNPLARCTPDELQAEMDELLDGRATSGFVKHEGRLPRTAAELDAWSNSTDEFTAYMAANPVQAAPVAEPCTALVHIGSPVVATVEPATTYIPVSVLERRHPTGRIPGSTVPTNPHAPVAEQTKKATTNTAKARGKAVDKTEAEALVAALVAGTVTRTAALLGSMTVANLVEVCRGRVKAGDTSLKGYSGLKKAELVAFMLSGTKPAAGEGTAREVKEALSAAKKAGLITGAVSALSKAKGEALLATVKPGTVVTVVKDEPKAGTVEWLKALCREHGVTKYSALTKAALVAHMFKLGNDALKGKLVAAGFTASK